MFKKSHVCELYFTLCYFLLIIFAIVHEKRLYLWCFCGFRVSHLRMPSLYERNIDERNNPVFLLPGCLFFAVGSEKQH